MKVYTRNTLHLPHPKSRRRTYRRNTLRLTHPKSRRRVQTQYIASHPPKKLQACTDAIYCVSPTQKAAGVYRRNTLRLTHPKSRRRGIIIHQNITHKMIKQFTFTQPTHIISIFTLLKPALCLTKNFSCLMVMPSFTGPTLPLFPDPSSTPKASTPQPWPASCVPSGISCKTKNPATSPWPSTLRAPSDTITTRNTRPTETPSPRIFLLPCLTSNRFWRP